MPRRLSTERPQKSKEPGNPKKPLIAAGIAIAAVFLLFIIGAGILAVNFLNRLTEDDTSTGQVTTMTYSIKQRSDLTGAYSRSVYANTDSAYDLYGEDAADMEGDTTLPNVTSEYGTGAEFEYGTIKGTKYTSKFSGITFDAPSGWTLKGASKSTVTPTSVLDLDAKNSTGSMSVKLQYFSLSGGSYTSVSQVKKALLTQIGDETSVTTKSRKIAGNNFSGYAFDGRNGQETARSEILVAQVKGYALVLQVIAPDQADIDNILKNFS